MKLSDAQIEYTISMTEAAWRHNKLSKSRMLEFLTTLRTYLTEDGIMTGVCLKCLGTGFAPRESTLNNLFHAELAWFKPDTGEEE